ncbi:hypothetical protein [Engelhardtia mirabilis]
MAVPLGEAGRGLPQVSMAQEYDTGVFSLYQPATVTPDGANPNKFVVTYEPLPSAFLWRESDTLPTEEFWLFPDKVGVPSYVTPSSIDHTIHWRIEYLQDGQALSDLASFRALVIQWFADNSSITLAAGNLMSHDRHVVIEPTR